MNPPCTGHVLGKVVLVNLQAVFNRVLHVVCMNVPIMRRGDGSMGVPITLSLIRPTCAFFTITGLL